MIQAIGFDFDHTLGVDNKLERTIALELIGETRSGNLDDAIRDIEPALQKFRSGEVEMKAALTAFFARHAPGRLHYRDMLELFMKRSVARAEEFVVPLRGALDLLAELGREGIPYAILSNGWSPLQEAKAAAIGVQCPVYVSEAIGVRKPERGAFEVLANHFRVPLAHIAYVGDDPRADCAGASEAGMTSIWFDWEGHHYPESLRPPTHTIHDLREVLAIVKGG